MNNSEGKTKYAIRIAVVPSNAVEGVTFMERKAVQDEINRAQSEGDYAHIECVDQEGTNIHVMVRGNDIQIWMHHLFVPKQQGRIAIPEPVIPRPRIEP